MLCHLGRDAGWSQVCHQLRGIPPEIAVLRQRQRVGASELPSALRFEDYINKPHHIIDCDRRRGNYVLLGTFIGLLVCFQLVGC